MIPQTVPPRRIRANIARARAYLHRGSIEKTLDALALALRGIAQEQLMSGALFELEVHVSEILRELINHKELAPIFAGRGPEVKKKFVYKRGNEIPLANVLDGLAALFKERAASEQEEQENNKEQRKQNLLDNGIHQLQAGNLPRGKAYLRRLADEYGDEPELLTLVAHHLSSAGLHYEAAEIYEEAITRFPRDAAAYRGAALSWMEAQAYQEAEDVFMRILRTFGAHASTYGKMAKLYLAWGRRQLMEEAINNALSREATQPDALEVEAELKRRAQRNQQAQTGSH